MTLDRNAKTTPTSRLLMVHRVTDAPGVTPRTVRKWCARCREGGVAALEDGSSRPMHQPRQTPAELVTTIALLRQ